MSPAESRSRSFRIARGIARPLAEFLQTEIAGGVVLLLATGVALIWANSAFSDAYEKLWKTELSLRVGGFGLSEDLRHWVNDGLMAIFFFVVGLEIKRELVRGELREARKAALPVVAALGGMVVPAIIYLALNGTGGQAGRGWGIPMATDIAFAVGVLALLGPRVPSSLKVFVLSLAIADDIGAITVIAVFYSDGIHLLPLGLAVGLLALVILLRSIRVWRIPVYVVLGVGVWLAVLESGVHATIAGVALGLLTPVNPLDPSRRSQIRLDGPEQESTSETHPRWLRETKLSLHASASVAERLEHDLHPWTSYVIIPVFALANAGVSLSRGALFDALGSSVTLGVALGLVAGKIVGITGFSWAAHRLGLGSLPDGTTWPQLIGAAAIAGIGFTVALFIAGLAFEDAAIQAQAKVGILLGSLLAAGIGAIVLRLAGRTRGVGSVE